MVTMRLCLPLANRSRGEEWRLLYMISSQEDVQCVLLGTLHLTRLDWDDCATPKHRIAVIVLMIPTTGSTQTDDSGTPN